MKVDISQEIHHLSVRNQNVNDAQQEYQGEVSCGPTSLAVEQQILRSSVLGIPNQTKQLIQSISCLVSFLCMIKVRSYEANVSMSLSYIVLLLSPYCPVAKC